MVHLKSFKYVVQETAAADESNALAESTESSSPANSTRSTLLESETPGAALTSGESDSEQASSVASVQERQESKQKVSRQAQVKMQLKRSPSSSEEQLASSAQASIDSDSQSQKIRQSTTEETENEEYQSIVHEMSHESTPDEDEGERDTGDQDKHARSSSGRAVAPKTGANLEQGKLEDIAKQRAAAKTQDNTSANDQMVTRITIERGSMVDLPAAAGGETPRVPRLQLSMPRAQTSPALGALMGASAATNGAAAGSWSPALAKRCAQTAAADNTSQFSFSTQRNYSTQFEIRWQNVRLFARRNRRVPKLIGDSWLYRWWARNGAGEGAEDDLSSNYCYSPPVQQRKLLAVSPVLAPTREPIDEAPELASGRGNGGGTPTPGRLELRLGAAAAAGRRSGGSQAASGPEAAELGTNGAANQSQGRCILNNISGQVFSGQMTAVLGPSGVGKTTLLNSLTGRNQLDGSGRVSLIGATTRKRMSVVTVPQVDVLPGKLSVQEDLVFTSRLKNPQSRFDHGRNISRIVKHLQMDKFLLTRIDKLSGGEQRRLSIARELLASPDIMILDEPTSGLDANTCKKIITALRDIVEHSDNILDKPMSIIVTIHQPQQEVYNLFHRIYVMAVGGRVVYEGPPGMLLPTFVEQSSLAKVTPREQLNENPAIVAIEVASGEYGRRIIDELADYHEDQVYEEFSILGPQLASAGLEGADGAAASPVQTPRFGRTPRMSPLSLGRFDMRSPLHHRKRLNSLGDSSIGRPTPIMQKRQFNTANQFDRMSSITSLSYASTYDADLPPEVSTRLKVDKRLRRSVVMKSYLFSHTWTLMQRCWLLATRDLFLMAIRIVGFLLVAAGTVQIFAETLDPNQHQCPQFESEVDDVLGYVGQIRQRLGSLEPMLKQSNAVHMFFFHILLCITMVTSALSGLVFPMQMRMFLREYKNGWYSPASFILSQTLAELPVDIIGPLITLLITYPLCQQPVSLYYWREIGYALVLVGCSIICKSQAQIIGAVLMDSVENSVFISCVCVVGPALLSGIPIRISQMVAPLQYISYGSFLRYGFESLMALRYGYGMCPCDPELIDGYPIDTSERAVPPQLNNFARGIIDLNRPADTANWTVPTLTDSSTSTTMPPLGVSTSIDDEHNNFILKFIRLVTDAANLMVPNAEELGDCNRYRSLYLLSIDVPNNIVPKWLGVMALMFIVSRFLTYFVVKTVIRFRRS